MKMIAKQTVNRVIVVDAKNPSKNRRVSHAPGDEFELDDKDEAAELIKLGAAEQKTRKVADTDDDGPKTVEQVLALAEAEDVSFAKFKAAAKKHLGETMPTKKDEIVEALKKLLPAA